MQRSCWFSRHLLLGSTFYVMIDDLRIRCSVGFHFIKVLFHLRYIFVSCLIYLFILSLEFCPWLIHDLEVVNKACIKKYKSMLGASVHFLNDSLPYHLNGLLVFSYPSVEIVSLLYTKLYRTNVHALRN